MTTPENETQITTELFMKGFLASLSQGGQTYISTIANDHQNRFNQVVDALDNPERTDSRVRERFPSFEPGPITGEFAEFDEALISLQGLGLTRCIGPYFHGVELQITQPRAEKIMSRFSESEQEVFGQLALVFIQGSDREQLV